MQVKLTIGERLKDLRKERKDLTLEKLAQQTGLSKSALGQYESNDYKDISPFAIVTLAKFYGVSTDYLLGVSENKKHPGAEVEALHLSDDMVDLLSSGRLNNRLLCEMALHPGFRQFFVDMEICIDGIADMRIRDMNQLLEATRQKIIQQYAPEEPDLHLRTLELAQISEDSFFSHVLHRDLDAIVRDLRETHSKDSTTADTAQTAADETADIRQQMLEALASEGTLQQKRARAAAVAMKLNYDRLSESDQKALERISSLSPVFSTVISQRGKAMTHGSGKRKKR